MRRQVSFTWQGGEPTLADLDFYQHAVELQTRHCPPGMRIENALQTNGTLLDDTWCEFFSEHLCWLLSPRVLMNAVKSYHLATKQLDS